MPLPHLPLPGHSRSHSSTTASAQASNHQHSSTSTNPSAIESLVQSSSLGTVAVPEASSRSLHISTSTAASASARDHSPLESHPPSSSDIFHSPQEYSHAPASSSKSQGPANRSSDPQPYQAYRGEYHPVETSASRPAISTNATAPAGVPQSMHRSNPSSGHAYSPNPAVSGGSGGSLDVSNSVNTSGRKYTHPGVLTPAHQSGSSSHHMSSHSTSSRDLGGMNLPGMGSSPRDRGDREDLVGGVGAVNPSKWLNPWGVYAVDWCKWQVPSANGFGRVAVGSYIEDSHNYIQVLDTRPGPPDPTTGSPSLEFVKLAEASHTYPVTRVLWEPPSSKPLTELLATSGDHLRLWSLPSGSATPSTGNSITSRPYSSAPSQKLTPLALLSNSKSTDFTAPLTSLDWNAVSPSLIITSSIDTTCTIWDIPTLTAKTQLIAHDKEVYDVRFMSNSVDVFASCGADGSVRMFDLRSLEHSTIIYEPGVGKASASSGSERDANVPSSSSPASAGGASPPALLKLAASPHDQHLIATFCKDSDIVRILDVRQPGQAMMNLQGHGANINCIDWNPGRRGILAAGADDSQVLVWDIYNTSAIVSKGSSNGATTGGHGHGHAEGGKAAASTDKEGPKIMNPVAWWGCEVEVNNLSWSPGGKSGSEWLGVVGGRGIFGVSV